jgi:hypothetical protein
LSNTMGRGGASAQPALSSKRTQTVILCIRGTVHLGQRIVQTPHDQFPNFLRSTDDQRGARRPMQDGVRHATKQKA